MFETVIVPLDGSPHAERALPVAIDEARRHGAAIVLLHVIARPESCDTQRRRSGPWQGAWPAAEIADAERRAHQYLSGVATRFHLGPTTARRVLVGHPGYRIATEACRYARPLIVLTTGDPTAEPFQRSHVLAYLVARGNVPILGVCAAAQDGNMVMTRPAPVPVVESLRGANAESVAASVS